METSQPGHILTQMGVLTSFSVAKKVTEKDVNDFFRKQKKMGKTDEQIGDILKKKIFDDIRDSIVNQKIPGLISPLEAMGSKVDESMSKNIGNLTRLIMIVSHTLTEKKYDKLSLCYFINSMVNLLGLTEQDFENFHRKASSNQNDDDDEEDA